MKRFLREVYLSGIDLLLRPLRRSGSLDPSHEIFHKYIALTKEAVDPAILELGSRNVSNNRLKNWFPECSDYVGVDIVKGEGVDVVADVHQISESFSPDRFDFIHSISVFEHLLFPWKAVLELNSVLKCGGYVYLATHPVWPRHELPWDFWRFPAEGFHSLFNQFTGFEIVELTEGLPCSVFSLVDDPPTRKNYLFESNQYVALLARKTGPYRRDLLKWDIDVSQVIETMYPSKG